MHLWPHWLEGGHKGSKPACPGAVPEGEELSFSHRAVRFGVRWVFCAFLGSIWCWSLPETGHWTGWSIGLPRRCGADVAVSLVGLRPVMSFQLVACPGQSVSTIRHLSCLQPRCSITKNKAVSMKQVFGNELSLSCSLSFSPRGWQSVQGRREERSLAAADQGTSPHSFSSFSSGKHKRTLTPHKTWSPKNPTLMA